jgi:hypothetical protein
MAALVIPAVGVLGRPEHHEDHEILGDVVEAVHYIRRYEDD